MSRHGGERYHQAPHNQPDTKRPPAALAQPTGSPPAAITTRRRRGTGPATWSPHGVRHLVGVLGHPRPGSAATCRTCGRTARRTDSRLRPRPPPSRAGAHHHVLHDPPFTASFGYSGLEPPPPYLKPARSEALCPGSVRHTRPNGFRPKQAPPTRQKQRLHPAPRHDPRNPVTTPMRLDGGAGCIARAKARRGIHVEGRGSGRIAVLQSRAPARGKPGSSPSTPRPPRQITGSPQRRRHQPVPSSDSSSNTYTLVPSSPRISANQLPKVLRLIPRRNQNANPRLPRAPLGHPSAVQRATNAKSPYSPTRKDPTRDVGGDGR